MTGDQGRDVAEALRSAMAQVPAPVAVVTTVADGSPYGTTVSAFMSLSMDPPIMLVSLDNTSTLLSHLQTGSRVGINVLGAAQESVARQLARTDKDMEALTASWEWSDEAAPRIPGCQAWIAMTVTELITVGDHTLVLGSVAAAQSDGGAPMVYWQRTYGSHTAA